MPLQLAAMLTRAPDATSNSEFCCYCCCSFPQKRKRSTQRSILLHQCQDTCSGNPGGDGAELDFGSSKIVIPCDACQLDFRSFKHRTTVRYTLAKLRMVVGNLGVLCFENRVSGGMTTAVFYRAMSVRVMLTSFTVTYFIRSIYFCFAVLFVLGWKIKHTVTWRPVHLGRLAVCLQHLWRSTGEREQVRGERSITSHLM